MIHSSPAFVPSQAHLTPRARSVNMQTVLPIHFPVQAPSIGQGLGPQDG